MSATARPGFDASLLLFGAIGAVLVVLVALPLGWLAWFSLTDEQGNPTFANFAHLLTDPAMRKPMAITLAIALGSAALSCLVAIPLA